MSPALTVELLKLRRSPVPHATAALIVVLVPALCLGFLAAAKQGGHGVAALKAQAMVAGEGWDAYLGLLAQMMSVTMFIGPGVVVAWMFGREFVDQTFPSLFAMPVSRGSIATAKFLVLCGWCVVVTILLLLVAIAVGVLAGVGPRADVDLAGRAARLFLSGSLTAMMSLTVGPVASIGRGYLPAIAAIIVLTMCAQVAVVLGAGAWFPYAAPGLYALAGADGAGGVTASQLLLVPLTTLFAVGLTVRWWKRAGVA